MYRSLIPAVFFAVFASAAVADPPEDAYLWLEEVDGVEAMTWVTEQNKRTRARLQAVPQFNPIQARFSEIYDSADRIPHAGFRGDYLYNFWQDARHPRGIWRRTHLTEYLKDSPAWETLLDLDQMSSEDDTLWVFKGSSCLPPSYRLCMIRLSPGGSDAAIQREYDTLKKQWVKGGFEVPLAKSRVAWRDENSLWVGTDFGEASLTTSGYPSQMRMWRRGTPLKASHKVLDIPKDWVQISAYSDYQGEYRYDYINATPAFFQGDHYLVVDDKPVKLDLPRNIDFQGFYREFMLVSPRSPWRLGASSYPTGSLLAIEVAKFMDGKPVVDVLFSPEPGVSLRGVSASRQGVLISTLDQVHGRLYTMSPQRGAWQRREIALPGPGSATISAAADYRDEWFFSYTDFLRPTTLYLVNGDKPAQPIKNSPAWFDSDGMQTRQFHTVSRDGTRIPYFVVTPKGFKPDGANPTVLYGYGGFEIPMLPRYSGTIGSAWLERGGVWVVANIRGGGEFGPDWHNSVLKENRHKVYEDFIAVAQDLLDRKITSARHLGIMGGSQGGLLVGAVTMMRPELFGAAVSKVPLLDMRRYTQLLAGASWIAEYGDPDIPAQWDYIKHWSPYQLLNAETEYPEMFIWTTTRDDRVHPGHARKMAAKMMGQGHETLYFERIEGGHSGGSTNAQRANNAALEWAYLWLKLGPAALPAD